VIAILVSTAAIALASIAIGGAILRLLDWPRPRWLAGGTGFAALVVLAPFLVRLPGRAATAAVLVGLIAIAGGAYALRGARSRAWSEGLVQGFAVAGIVVALGSLPFLINDATGVLGEGIYTNDHAAQLYWADWLASGFGPEPSAVRFGYPVGPQALAAIAAELPGVSLVDSFNGLLLAIAALTGLTALGALGGLRAVPRAAVAALSALPYLAASFLAQSAFKETAMALFVLAFAAALTAVERVPGPAPDERPARPRAMLAVGVLLALAAVFTFSLPGLAWFALALVIWLGLEAVVARGVVDFAAIRSAGSDHRVAVAVALLLLIASAALALGPATSFIEKIDDVGGSVGRLSSPVFPGEALGIWPQGDFRIVRTEVDLAVPALVLGALAAAVGGLVLLRRRDWALLAMLASAAIVYLLARVFAQIHVEAKALAVAAPLALLVSLRALLEPADEGIEGRALSRGRQALGVVVAVCALASTLLALRSAPIGPDERAGALEQLAERVDGETVAFLGVDRFAGYRLRGTLIRAPAGYVPQEIQARPEKTWQQGDPADFDSLDSGQLDRFRYVITTTAAYASSPPPSYERVAEAGGYALWRRQGATPRSRVLERNGEPGAVLDCFGGEDRRLSRRRPGEATVLTEPAVAGFREWSVIEPVEDAAAGQELGFAAPAEVSNELNVLGQGRHRLSLQYHSQVPLEVLVDGERVAELPASLDGMYLDGAGRGAFWPAGEFDSAVLGPVTVTVRAAEPSGLQDALGVERRVWLGGLAATLAAPPQQRSLSGACGRYVDRYALERRGKGS